MKPILYFDIDGTLLNYEDAPKSSLRGGYLEQLLKVIGFEQLICISAWNDIYNDPIQRLTYGQQKELIYKLLSHIFIDKEWFMSRLILMYNTDNRCSHIDLSTDYYFIDDWADEFFIKEFGEGLYKEELGKRVLLADPYDDGSPLLEWLNKIANKYNHPA